MCARNRHPLLIDGMLHYTFRKATGVGLPRSYYGLVY